MNELLYPSIFEGVLRVHCKLCFLAHSLEVDPALIESHILLGIAESKGTGPTALVSVVNLDRSTISRTVLGLEKAGYVEQRSSDRDRRALTINVTEKGKQLLERWQEQMYQLTEQLSFGLNRAEQQILTTYLRRLADHQRADSIENQSIHPLHRELFRLSRATGILGRTFFNTGRALSEIQVLSVLSNKEGPQIFSSIADGLPFDKSTLSRVLGKLVKRQEIIRREVPEDKRSVSLELTAEGVVSLHQILQLGAQSLRGSLLGFSQKELHEFDDLLKRIAPIDPEALRDTQSPGEIRVAPLFQDQERSIARGFYIENQVRLGEHYHLPEKMFSGEGLSYGCYLDSRLQGVCEFQRHSGRWILKIFYVNRPVVDDETHVRFLHEALSNAITRLKQDSIEIGPGILSAAQREHLSGKFSGFLTLVEGAA